MPPKVGSIFPNQIPKVTYDKIEEDVVIRVNLLMAAFQQSGGKKGIDPRQNYNLRYDKRKGRLYVDFWYGDKKYAWLRNEVATYDIADFMDNGEITLKVQRKEVIL